MADIRDIAGRNISEAWINALVAALQMPGHAGVHTVVRISDPSLEHEDVRQLADGLMVLADVRPIDTVASTIFPTTWAERHPDPVELANHYRERYPILQRFRANRRGTYFGRVVEYPMGEGEQPFDQLNDLIGKLRTETRARDGHRPRGLSSRYEVNVWRPGDLPAGMGFPCMAHMSFHMVDRRLHLTAQYRNQYLIERAYGNYVGLAGLLSYVAGVVGLDVGELMVVGGHVELDTHGRAGIRVIRQLIADAQPALSEGN
jgi:Thymidylate synthase